jgi:2'-5' RNA ligase
MSAKARLFFALWPDEGVRAAFSEWLRVLDGQIDGRLTRPESLHVTLVFLGDQELSRIDSLNHIAGEIDARSFELAFDAPRYWAHNRIAHAVPLETPEALVSLVTALEQRLHDAGFRFEERAYIPHATLMRRARWKKADLKFGRVNWLVNDFALVRSHPGPTGSSYEVLGRWKLKA